MSIGTHDLDTLKAPFRYEAKAPTGIKFAPLNKTTAYNGEELMKLYEVSWLYSFPYTLINTLPQSDKHLSRYLHIIRDSPVYPIWYDTQDQVLSLPPIINSNHSKITIDTKNVFIELTALDETKLAIVTNILCIMFAEYCEEPFT